MARKRTRLEETLIPRDDEKLLDIIYLQAKLIQMEEKEKKERESVRNKVHKLCTDISTTFQMNKLRHLIDHLVDMGEIKMNEEDIETKSRKYLCNAAGEEEI